MDLHIKAIDGGVTLDCHITPRSSRRTIRGVRNGALAVSLQSPPVDGQANAELIKFISKLLGIPKSNVQIIKGQLSRHKSLIIHDVNIEDVIRLLSD
ncbi:MAG: YggU family protein [Deltaproteobacteria bacterium]|jgi:uncharacterized protein|nr:YggU family protein [Deltaproteobacteria bacterium]